MLFPHEISTTYEVLQPAYDLQHRMCCLQSLFKDNEVEAFVIIAQLCHDGWVPLQQLVSARAVRGWFKEFAPDALLHPATALEVMSAKLQQQKPDSGKHVLDNQLCMISNRTQISIVLAANCNLLVTQLRLLVWSDSPAPLECMLVL